MLIIWSIITIDNIIILYLSETIIENEPSTKDEKHEEVAPPIETPVSEVKPEDEKEEEKPVVPDDKETPMEVEEPAPEKPTKEEPVPTPEPPVEPKEETPKQEAPPVTDGSGDSTDENTATPEKTEAPAKAKVVDDQGCYW